MENRKTALYSLLSKVVKQKTGELSRRMQRSFLYLILLKTPVALLTALSKHLCTVGRQLEGCPQHISSTTAHQHPLQENLKVFVHAADVGVDLQVQRDDL